MKALATANDCKVANKIWHEKGYKEANPDWIISVKTTDND